MKAVALMYHDVTSRGGEDLSGFPGGEAARYKLPADVFAEHLRAIRARTLRRPVTAGSPLLAGASAAPSFFLTFDDGGNSAEAIADCLEAFGWPGHFFVTTNYIGRPGFVTRDQIRRLRAGGHIVGSHSCTHPLRMARCSPARLRDEWMRSVGTLSDVLQEQVTVASVPGGDYSAIVADAAQEAGIRVLFTSQPTVQIRRHGDVSLLGRFAVRRSTSSTLVARVAAGAWIPRVKQRLWWDLKIVGKMIAGSSYERIRAKRLGRSAEVRWGDDLAGASEDPS